MVGASTASAHSYFVLSDPPDGSILEHAPARVILAFSSGVNTDFTTIQLVEAQGAHYAPTSIHALAGQPNFVVVNLPQIPNGSYRLDFSTRDTVDLHETAGSIVFGVGEAPATASPAPVPVPPRPSEVVLRWLALAGLSAILGCLTVALLVVGRLPVETAVRSRIQRSLFGFGLFGAGLVLAGETGLLLDKASSLGPIARSIGLMAGSEYGARWLAIVIIVAGLTPLVAALWMNARRGEVAGLIQEFRGKGMWALLTNQVRVVVIGLALTVAMALSGHVAGTSGTSVGGVSLLALHIGAMGVWAGGVVALTLAVLTLRRATGQTDRPALIALAVGFGPFAAVAFATLGATGLLLSGMQVATVTALLSTQYGAVLLTKIGLIGVVALFGLRHALLTWRGLRRRVADQARFPSRLPLTIALEATGAIAVVALAAVLSASAPAIGPQFAPPGLSPNITQLTREQDDLLITLAVKPNRSGPNLVSARLVPTTRPARGPVQNVTILVSRPDDPQGQLMATTRSGSAFDAGSVRLGAGDVSFTVKISRAGIGDTVVTVPWRVEALDVARVPVVVSNQPLAPVVNLAALLVMAMAALTIGGGALVLCRSRPLPLPAPVRQGNGGPLPRHRYTAAVPPASHRRAGVGLGLRRRGWLRRSARRR